MPAADSGVPDYSRALSRIENQLEATAREARGAREYAQKTDQGIDALRESFEQLYKQLHRQFEEVIKKLTVLEQVPNLFQHFEELVQVQFRISFLRQFESLVIGHQAQLVSRQNQLRTLHAYLDSQHGQYDREYAQVQERYQLLLRKLADGNLERRKRLDSHAYALLETTYPTQVQERFSGESRPWYAYFGTHSMEAGAARTTVLGRAFHALRDAFDGHSARRSSLYGAVDRCITNLKPGSYALPCWVVEIEEIVTKKRRYEVHMPKGVDVLPSITREVIRAYAVGEAKRVESKGRPLPDMERNRLVAQLKDTHKVCESERLRFGTEHVLCLDSLAGESRK